METLLKSEVRDGCKIARIIVLAIVTKQKQPIQALGQSAFFGTVLHFCKGLETSRANCSVIEVLRSSLDKPVVYDTILVLEMTCHATQYLCMVEKRDHHGLERDV